MEDKGNIKIKYLHSDITKNKNNKFCDEYKIYAPKITKKYKKTFKILLKFTKDRDRTLYIMYNKVKKWYKDENINMSMEKIYIKSKLGSYLSGGCGIEASLLTNLTASAVFAYSSTYIKKLGTISLLCYLTIMSFYGLFVLSKEDDEVEMYNLFLEVLSELERRNE
ncbi:hypothetical protein [Clostridium taeniosporum]|uniref:Uncharacterized protein n=1 Tax=Clostridium taeniosporum TaxID=394958 RepID=A0A1D7XJM0_9CLOT|nr:hypothetical protein [Clostridium taeniosporum]AOR23526.1 hypothetical protein BGI42_07165 [Clostridium taeniosporum]